MAAKRTALESTVRFGRSATAAGAVPTTQAYRLAVGMYAWMNPPCVCIGIV